MRAKNMMARCFGRTTVVALTSRVGTPVVNTLNIHEIRFRKKYSSVLVSSVYPDVSASAACVRTNSIVKGLSELPLHSKQQRKDCSQGNDKNNDIGNKEINTSDTNHVYYATTSLDDSSKNLQKPFRNHSATIEMIHLPPNRSDIFEQHFSFNNKQQECNIDMVVFDRFFVEEAHSFRFRERFPNAALVLDMQDMHSLRWGRQQVVQSWDRQRQQGRNTDFDPLGCLPRVMDYLPTAENEKFLRELASIHRSDLTLVCSPEEMHLLRSVYNIPKEKLCLASFFVDERSLEEKQLPVPPNIIHENRSNKEQNNALQAPHFVFCGGFKHEPNADAVRILIEFVWPRLQEKLPEATLHIYGAFCPDHLKNQHRKSSSIRIHGYEPDLAKIFGQDGGILLAPLRFGAGIKGKIIDAWTFGMPVVTTPIGSEGMTMHNDSEIIFGGNIASSLENFCDSAIELVLDPTAYTKAQAKGRALLKTLFPASENWGHVQQRFLEVLDGDTLTRARNIDIMGSLLWHQSMRSTDYFSRWIELKESIVRSEQTRDAAAPSKDAHR